MFDKLILKKEKNILNLFKYGDENSLKITK